MFRPFSVFVGLRYTGAKRRNHFISFISLTSMIGLTLGVLAMIVVLSVMNGFQKEMSTRILGTVPHASISHSQPITDWQALSVRLLQDKAVTGVAPFAELEGMLSYKGLMQPIQINGVEPTEEAKVSILSEHMLAGRLEDLTPGEFGVILGAQSARRFGLRVGDKLTLIIPEMGAVPGGVTPTMHRLTLVGVFRVGAELDGNLGLIHIQDAASMRRLENGAVPSVRLKLADMQNAPQIAKRLAIELGEGYTPHDWTEVHGSLFNAMKMEKTMIGLLLTLIVAVAAFNIIATLIMVVSDKRSDIAILRTLGATPFEVMKIFMVQGTLIGLIGTFIGGVLGVVAALHIADVVGFFERTFGGEMLRSDMYYINALPSDLQWTDVVLICSVALIMSFLATLYPSWKASKIAPAEALRYD